MPQPLYPQRNELRYPLDRRVGEPQNQSGRGGEERKPLSLPSTAPRSPSAQSNHYSWEYEDVSKSFRTEPITKPTTINNRWEATQRVMVAKLTRLTHKIAIQLHLVAESWTICSSRSRQPVRRLLDTPSYMNEQYRTVVKGWYSRVQPVTVKKNDMLQAVMNVQFWTDNTGTEILSMQ
jgi:hypothetical protein